MSRLEPETERRLVRLSQEAQYGLLELLNHPGAHPSTQQEALNSARTLLEELATLASSRPSAAPASLRLPKASRRLLEQRLSRLEPVNPVQGREAELRFATEVVRRLLSGERVADNELIRCVSFVRDVMAVHAHPRHTRPAVNLDVAID